MCSQQLLPGMRQGDERLRGLKIWDDTKHGRRTADGQWGAGWVCDHTLVPTDGQKAKARWLNIRKWGSWRFAFVLARLQRQVWLARYPPPEVTSPPPGRHRRVVLDGS